MRTLIPFLFLVPSLFVGLLPRFVSAQTNFETRRLSTSHSQLMEIVRQTRLYRNRLFADTSAVVEAEKQYWSRTLTIDRTPKTCVLTQPGRHAQRPNNLPAFSYHCQRNRNQLFSCRHCVGPFFDGYASKAKTSLGVKEVLMLGNNLEFIVCAYAMPKDLVVHYYPLVGKERMIALPFKTAVLPVWSQAFFKQRGRLFSDFSLGESEFDTEKELQRKRTSYERKSKAAHVACKQLWRKMARITVKHVPLVVQGRFDGTSKSFRFVTPTFQRHVFGEKHLHVSTYLPSSSKSQHRIRLVPYRENRFYIECVRTFKSIDDAKPTRSRTHTVDLDLLMSPKGSFVIVGAEFKVDGKVIDTLKHKR